MMLTVSSLQLNREAMKNAANIKIIVKLVLWNILVVGLAVLMTNF